VAEKRDGGSPADAVQHRLGADEHARRRCGLVCRLLPVRARGPIGSWSPSAGSRHLTDVDAEECRKFFAQAAHADAQGLHLQATTVRAHDGTRVATARATQDLLVFRAGDSGATARAPGQIATVGARKQAGAAGSVVHADERAAFGGGRVVEHRPGEPDELLREDTAARVGAAAVHRLEGGPSRALVV
jgi:hypothetical protein